MNLLDDFSIEI